MSENETESSNDSAKSVDAANSVEDQLAEISEFEHKIRLLRWGMVVGTLLIIALGVINIINKVQKTIEPVRQVITDTKEMLPKAQETFTSVQNIMVGGDQFDKIANNFRDEVGGLRDIPEQVAESAKDELVLILNGREDKIRELFPNLDRAKQDALLGALAQIAEDRGDEVLISLFADHIHEIDKINTYLETIHTKEAQNITAESNMQAGLMLVSNVLDLLVTTVNDLKANIDDTRLDK